MKKVILPHVLLLGACICWGNANQGPQKTCEPQMIHLTIAF